MLLASNMYAHRYREKEENSSRNMNRIHKVDSFFSSVVIGLILYLNFQFNFTDVYTVWFSSRHINCRIICTYNFDLIFLSL